MLAVRVGQSSRRAEKGIESAGCGLLSCVSAEERVETGGGVSFSGKRAEKRIAAARQGIGTRQGGADAAARTITDERINGTRGIGISRISADKSIRRGVREVACGSSDKCIGRTAR